MKNQDYKSIEHRGNANEVISNLELELQLVKNVNQEEPIYSFNVKNNEENKTVDFKGNFWSSKRI